MNRPCFKSIVESFPADVAFLVQDLTKSHTSSMVIKAFNLEVKKGECIGILGPGGNFILLLLNDSSELTSSFEC
jgi:ABC-type transporter Mla maintaining outer membrane lipid asymmetry ATPase subunit MlaF